MGLNPTGNWLRAANSGSAEPVLKFEFSPTIAYAEKRGRTDWQTGENLVEIDTGHHSDELRLARSRSDVRRLVEQGAVEADGNKVDSIIVTMRDGGVLKVGKRGFLRVYCRQQP